MNIYIDPLIPIRIYAGIPWLGIYKTEDGGTIWENISEGLPQDCSVMKVQKNNSDRLFIVGTYDDDGGIYEYSFSQNLWTKIGIVDLQVSYYDSDLKTSSNPERLYFGGKGGIYVMDLKKYKLLKDVYENGKVATIKY